MKPSARILLALAAALVAAPLAAQQIVLVPEPEPLPDLSAMSGEEVLALFRKTSGRWMREPCTFGVPVTTAMEEKVGKTVPIRRARLYAAALCADRKQRYAEGAALAQELNAVDPAQQTIALPLYFARRLEDADMALAILGGVEGKALGDLDKDEFWAISRLLARQGRGKDLDALALAWVAGGQLAFIDGELHESIAVRGLRAAARTGRADLVDTLLLSITSPPSYIDLLTLRDYEPFWPQIEQRAGPNLALVGDEHVRSTRARLTNLSKDRDRLSDAAYALHYNGQYADAIALAQRWRQRAGPDAPFEEGDGWALNIEAYAYDSLGQIAKADAVFDELAKLDADEHPWVVNFVINRASRLVGQGRWKEGLKATVLARSVAQKHGSTYAKLIIARDRACTFERLGRGQEAASELAFLRDNAKDGIGLSVSGLICHGQRDEAAAMLLAALRDEGQRGDALSAFQTDELDLFYTASILPDARDLLADHPELAAELALHVRDMPAAYVPQAALKRVALKEGPAR